jgi:hypothetical protein
MTAMADYGRPKNVKVSVETRGAGTPEYVQQIGMKPWEFMLGIIKDAGANSNVDIGNVGAMNQQELHDCIKAWLSTSSGNMHVKSSPFWDIGQAVRFTESLGYKGLYSIEVSRHEAVRIAYNTILAISRDRCAGCCSGLFIALVCINAKSVSPWCCPSERDEAC